MGSAVGVNGLDEGGLLGRFKKGAGEGDRERRGKDSPLPIVTQFLPRSTKTIQNIDSKHRFNAAHAQGGSVHDHSDRSSGLEGVKCGA